MENYGWATLKGEEFRMDRQKKIGHFFIWFCVIGFGFFSHANQTFASTSGQVKTNGQITFYTSTSDTEDLTISDSSELPKEEIQTGSNTKTSAVKKMFPSTGEIMSFKYVLLGIILLSLGVLHLHKRRRNNH